MINSNVTFEGKRHAYLSIALNELNKLGIDINKAQIEKAIHLTKKGIVNDSRYFRSSKLQVVNIILKYLRIYTGSNKLQRKRCCTIDKAIFGNNLLKTIYECMYGLLFNASNGTTRRYLRPFTLRIL